MPCFPPFFKTLNLVWDLFDPKKTQDYPDPIEGWMDPRGYPEMWYWDHGDPI